jgi:hypothetical protein
MLEAVRIELEELDNLAARNVRFGNPTISANVVRDKLRRIFELTAEAEHPPMLGAPDADPEAEAGAKKAAEERFRQAQAAKRLNIGPGKPRQ